MVFCARIHMHSFLRHYQQTFRVTKCYSSSNWSPRNKTSDSMPYVNPWFVTMFLFRGCPSLVAIAHVSLP